MGLVRLTALEAGGVRNRAMLVKTRTTLGNHLRAILKPFG